MPLYNLIHKSITMLKNGLIMLIIVFSLQANCRDFYYTYDFLPIEYYQCFKKNGSDRIGILIQQSVGEIRDESVQSIKNAKSAGLKVEGVHTACRARRSAEEEVNLIIKTFGLNAFDKFWIYPDGLVDNTCSWEQYSSESNCQYLQNLIQLFITKYGVPVDVLTQVDSWISSFKSPTSCPQASKISNLWWVPDRMQDQKPDFSNYLKIGGWETPIMKSYAFKLICGEELLVNYYV